MITIKKMGSCAACQGKQSALVVPYEKGQLAPEEYPKSLQVNCKIAYPRAGGFSTTVQFACYPPQKQDDTEATWNDAQVPISATIFPGAMSSLSEVTKPCQDQYTILHDSEKILLCLFDGHGSNSEHLVSYLVKVCNKYFKQKKVPENPLDYVRELMNTCEGLLERKHVRFN
jgi:hypothetical protein